MKGWVKGGLIGLIAWVVLLVLLNLGINYINCPEKNGEGYICFDLVRVTLQIVSFPFFFVGANPYLGGTPSVLFWIGSLISFALWGILLGLIFTKIKTKRK